MHGLDQQGVQSFDLTAQDISAQVAAHRAQAATMSDLAACPAAGNAYDAHVRPLIERMQQMSGSMDDRMGSMHGGDADMGCGSDAMHAELDRHMGAACASSDIAINQAEASRHADLMDQLVAHQRGRAAELASMMGMGGGGMMGGHMVDGGWVMDGGGMMALCSRAADGGPMMDGGAMMDGGPMGGPMDGGPMMDGGMDGGPMDGGPMMDGGMR